MGWFLCLKNFTTRERYVRDLIKFPELRWLDRFDILIPILYGISMWGFGFWLSISYPELHTSGGQMIVWGYFISTIALIHCTLCVNSLAHVMGSKRYITNDDSRNNGLVAFLTLGEGWHNNHHHYPVSARQGFFWWEIDVSYYLLTLMAYLGLVWDLQPIPVERLRANLISQEAER